MHHDPFFFKLDDLRSFRTTDHNKNFFVCFEGMSGSLHIHSQVPVHSLIQETEPTTLSPTMCQAQKATGHVKQLRQLRTGLFPNQTSPGATVCGPVQHTGRAAGCNSPCLTRAKSCPGDQHSGVAGDQAGPGVGFSCPVPPASYDQASYESISQK